MTHANSEDLPLSPWAKRFYPSTDPYWRTLGGQIHSSLAPEFPSLHVDGYRWDPTLGPLPKPDNQSLDRLFYAERSQRGILGGVQSWQVAAIASQPYGYGPKDPLPEHSRDPAWERFWQERVVVNEVSWFPFFHRVRWFDLRANCFESIRDPFPEMRDHSTNWWTVDNWVIWDHLSVSIEIANRILRRLIDERDIWLDALLFRDRISWSLLNSDIQLKASTELGYDPQLLLPLTDPKFTADSATMAARMEQLNDRTVFGFFDEAGSWDEFKAYGLSSVTDMPMQSGEKVPWNTILIHVGFLRTLCDRDTSLSERCNMQAVLAFTILHELMHATYWGKQRERGFQAPITEPYVYPELKCELGASFEYNTFGGVTREVPSVPATYNFTGLNTHVNMYSWPRWFETGDLPEAVTLKTSTLPITFDYTIPLLWTSALQNEAFWKRVVEKHGKVAFRAPRILRSEVWGPWYGIGSRAFGIHRMRVDDNTPEELKAGYISVLNRWQERRINWDYMRQWYPDEYRKWSLSPWSWTYAREVIGNFREAHGRKDIFKCLEFARELMRGETAFLALRDTTSDNPMTWLFVSIGTLMCASIPLLTQDVDFAGPMKLVEIHPNSQGVPPFAVSTTGSIKLTELQMEALRDRSTTSKSHWPHPVHGIYAFWNDFYPSAKKHPMPKVWLEATYDVARSLWNRHVAGTQTNEWLPWDFQIPHYDTQWAIASETGTVENGMNMLTFDPCDPPITEAGRLMSPPPSPTDIGPNMLPTSGSVPTVSMRKKGKNDLKDAPERRYPKYYTVSEVGNHILSNESTWVIEPDGESGFDVYRITKLCRKLGYTTGKRIRSELLTVGPYGPMLRTDGGEDEMWTAGGKHAAKIREVLGKSTRPIGKLLMHRRPQEIAEYDGKNGMPVWITVGADVFNVTNFSFANRKEWENMTQNRPPKLPDSTDNRDDLLQRLLDCKCALVRGSKSMPRPVLLPFTMKMLSWHDNPRAGCYTAINDIVYDITTYLEMHPGGKNILINSLGRVTDNFYEHHDQELLDFYPEWRIGRLVAEMRLDQLRKHQIAIHESVFDISGLAPDKTNNKMHQWIYACVSAFGGTDASETITQREQSNVRDALLQLYTQQKERIVGHVVRDGDEKLKEIPDGELVNRLNARKVQGAWTVVDGLVYDVTPIILFGEAFYEHQIPEAFVGVELNDASLAYWLSNTYPHRVIGRLVKGDAWPEPTIGQIFKIKEVDPLVTDQREETNEPFWPLWNGPLPQDLLDWVRTSKPSRVQIRDRLVKRVEELDEVKARIKAAADTTTTTGKKRRASGDELGNMKKKKKV